MITRLSFVSVPVLQHLTSKNVRLWYHLIQKLNCLIPSHPSEVYVLNSEESYWDPLRYSFGPRASGITSWMPVLVWIRLLKSLIFREESCMYWDTIRDLMLTSWVIQTWLSVEADHSPHMHVLWDCGLLRLFPHPLILFGTYQPLIHLWHSNTYWRDIQSCPCRIVPIEVKQNKMKTISHLSGPITAITTIYEGHKDLKRPAGSLELVSSITANA